ncbi:hypothetical protein [Streptomyces indicus]|uniref:Lipoprotein n=1 Tax=Streptomyces indicus TaxID=417292 RepID=A0A1G8TIA9_9ACTN|nr:hypothetical protein [Streptomyces indicus]SDJ40410.1 hypothetical protein SAMN05421806_101244 [Streptomyces indicus]
MRRLTRTLPAAALALAVGGCGFLVDTADDGPGERTAFVELGPLAMRPDHDLRGTRLGPRGEAERLYAALEAAEAGKLPQVRKALTVTPADGEVGLAIVLPGCRNTGARLAVKGRTVSAELTGGENVNCGQAEYFLATFEIPAGDLPDNWTSGATP